MEIYFLKGGSSRVYLERFKFLLLQLLATSLPPTADEELELLYLKVRLLDETDINFIRAHKLILHEAMLVYDVLQNKKSKLSFEQKVLRVKKLLASYQSKLKVGNAYFGKVYSLAPPSMLGKRHSSWKRKSRVVRRYIGVGYKDQGTMRNIAKDGSPGWKEVCVANIPGPVLPRMTYSDLDGWRKYYGPFHRVWDRLTQEVQRQEEERRRKFQDFLGR